MTNDGVVEFHFAIREVCTAKEESSFSANAVFIRVPHHRGQSSARTSQSGKISEAGSGFRTGEVEGLVPCNHPENEKKKKISFPVDIRFILLYNYVLIR